MPLNDYGSAKNPPYPKDGDTSVVRRDAETKELAGGKVALKTMDGWLSVFPSQLRPIADYLDDHPELPTVKVLWDGHTVAGRTTAVIATKLK